jgi:RNA polymerase sigma factor (sigma-70 family)
MEGGGLLAERENLYAEIQPLVQRLIRQYGQDREMQQDLRGEIFRRFCTLLEEYDPARGVPLRPYLIRKLTASVYTYARSQWQRRQREVSLESPLPARTPEPWDVTRDWDQTLVLREMLKELPAAVSTLSARQRYVVVARFYEGHSFAEIAETLQVCPATARSLLRHGIRHLRRHFGDQGLGMTG